MAGVFASLSNGFLRVHHLHSVLLHSVIILSCSWLPAASAQDGKMKCTAMSTARLEDTTLTCHFPEDLSVTKRDFTVYHYVKGRPADAVVDCWWVHGEVGCAVKQGFEYNKVVTTNLTVTLKRVTSALTGTYACQVAGYGPESLETCQVELDNTCTVTYEKSGRGANVTCSFKEDIQATSRNVSVYKLTGQKKQVVAECFWKEKQPQCWTESGYNFDYSYLTLWIPQVTSEQDGNYSCWHPGYNTEEQKTCLLDVAGQDLLMEYTNQPADQRDNTGLAVGLTLGILVLLAVVVIVLFLKNKEQVMSWFSTWRLREQKQEGGEGAEDDAPFTNKKDPNYQMITKRFQEHLEKQTQSMFPNMLKKYSFYFVPPIYFNKTRYRKEIVSGQDVFVPEQADPCDVRHDQAMLHVFNCLHDLAKHDQKEMFVLTQFKYDDYLKSLGNEFQGHRLPIPAGLTKKNQNIQCFDFMIVYRNYGVLVGVVKAVGDNITQDAQQPVNDVIVNAVTEAVQQLKKAAHMIQYLMSDEKDFPRVCQTLILPNLARATLQLAIADHSGLAQGMFECLGTNEAGDPTKLCLCAEDLEDPRLVSGVISRMLTANNTEDNFSMTDDLYIRILSRFCGPATRSALEGQCQSIYLPKTQVEAVSVTGDLYHRLILYQDMLDLITKQRLFLVGPPNTGKTLLLRLALGDWQARGYDVCVVSGPSDSRDWAFSNPSTQNIEEPQTNIASPNSVSKINCNFNSKSDMEKELNMLIHYKVEKALCVVADDVDSIGTCFKPFCESLTRNRPDVFLWATSSSEKNVPDGWQVKTFTQTLNCPPAVAREASSAGANYDVPCSLSPTDGPEVEYTYHKKRPGLKIHNCTECGRMVANLLEKFITKKDASVPTDEETITPSTPFMSGEEESASVKGSVLRSKDLLVLYEERGEQLVSGLRSSGIPVRTLNTNERTEVFDEENECAYVLHIDQLTTYRPRRKIVVYVEGKSKLRELSKKWRGITSCTSQLIVMRWNP